MQDQRRCHRNNVVCTHIEKMLVSKVVTLVWIAGAHCLFRRMAWPYGSGSEWNCVAWSSSSLASWGPAEGTPAFQNPTPPQYLQDLFWEVKPSVAKVVFFYHFILCTSCRCSVSIFLAWHWSRGLVLLAAIRKAIVGVIWFFLVLCKWKAIDEHHGQVESWVCWVYETFDLFVHCSWPRGHRIALCRLDLIVTRSPQFPSAPHLLCSRDVMKRYLDFEGTELRIRSNHSHRQKSIDHPCGTFETLWGQWAVSSEDTLWLKV